MRPFLRMFVLGVLWVGYILGAIIGALLEGSIGILSLLIPAAGLFVFAVLDLIHPFSTPKRRKELLGDN